MRELSQIDQITFSDLTQKSLDAEFEGAYPPSGSFFLQQRTGKKYWYYKGYDQKDKHQYLKYVGPEADPDVLQRIREFGFFKSGYRVRRELASKLRAARLPSPTRFEGEVLAALTKAGLFRLRAVLVGSLAYQTYSGVLGIRLPDPLMRTGDLDLAQFFGISQQLDDVAEDVESKLREVDPSFRPLFNPNTPQLAAGFISASGYRVEFLTPNRGDRAYEFNLAPMPAFGPGIGAQVLRFLDFAITQPIRSVVLHGAGVPVTVPAPERYAVHKLIVSTARGRDSTEKSQKDIAQAGDLIEAFALTRRDADLGMAVLEAVDRGSSWRRRVLRASLRLSEQRFSMLSKAVQLAAELENRDPEAIGLTGGRQKLLQRLAIRSGGGESA